MKQAIKTVLIIAVVLMVIDFLGMIAWAMSGQFPTDSFYLGAISRNIIQVIFF